MVNLELRTKEEKLDVVGEISWAVKTFFDPLTWPIRAYRAIRDYLTRDSTSVETDHYKENSKRN